MAAGGPGCRVVTPGVRLVTPALVLVAAVTGTAVAAVVATSLGLVPLVGRPRLSVEAFAADATELLAAARESLLIATVATALAALTGLGLATVVLRSSRRGRVLVALAAAVVTVPHLVGAASTSLLLSDVGVAQRFAGVPAASWPELVGGALPWATVLELAWKESAFIALVVVGSAGARFEPLRETAAVLGASKRQQWRRVLLPLAAPALAASSLIAFVYAVGSYEVPRLLGRAYPEPLPVMSYRLFTDIDVTARPQAAAVAVLTTALALVVAAVCLPLVRRLGAER